MKYYIIAGEASGDLHGSNLIREIRKHDPEYRVRCWGGDMMQQAGGDLVKHYRDLAFMGFTEVIRNLPTILQNLKFCKEDIIQFQPDGLILIDYPGFNLRIAKWAKQQGFKIIYYISPQVWAWKENRVQTIKECVDKMLVILPFEKEFYKKWDYPVDYVGHPLVEVIDRFRAERVHDHSIEEAVGETKQGIVALLPGSRRQEILKKLPVMLAVSKHFPDHRFVVARAPGQEDEFYDSIMKNYPEVASVKGKTYELLMHAKAACVTSGTATLETALFSVPEVVCYKGSQVSYQIARRLIKVDYISLVNLIMNKAVVKELIQQELTEKNLQKELHPLLFDKTKQDQMKSEFGELKEILSQGGPASSNAARIIISFLKPTPS